MGIATTVFWIGEQATDNNPVGNDKSAWDSGWISSYGGIDSPDARPTQFCAGQVSFRDKIHSTLRFPTTTLMIITPNRKPRRSIPWFKNSFVRDGQSVCKGRWVAIRHGFKVCYAQWEDVGPFQTDHWQYVFGNERPRPNRNQDAGLDVSPAVREYLGLDNIGSCDWKFVDFLQVPAGPWALYGDNNTFSRLRRPKSTTIAVSRHGNPPF